MRFMMTLLGALPPAGMASMVAMGPYFLYAIVEKFPVQVIPGHRNAPRPLFGAGLAQGWRSSREKRTSPG